MKKFLLRIGFVCVFFIFAVPSIISDITGLNIQAIIKIKIDSMGINNFIIIFLVFCVIIISFIFLISCIINFWKRKYNVFIKLIVIILSFITYFVPMLIYYILVMEKIKIENNKVKT